jgi:Protein of unknown function (DUF4239)
MHSFYVSLIVFLWVFGGAVVGMLLRKFLPEDHLTSDAKDVVRLATGLVVTMAALVLGMLVSSAKGSYDFQKTEVATMAAKIVLLDRVLATYGPETAETRVQLRYFVESSLERTWPNEKTKHSDLMPRTSVDRLFDNLQALTPKNDQQSAARSEALAMSLDLRESRWIIFLESENNSISIPLLIVVVSWLAAIFISFGLFAPPNGTVIVTLIVCAIAVSAAIFIIQEMYSPFSGFLKISSAPIRDALNQLGN